MTITVETFLVVALAFAVFAAVMTVGSSVVLGIGYERLRHGFETIRKQTGFFSDQIYQLDQRVDTLERNDGQPLRPATTEQTDTPDNHIHAPKDSPGVLVASKAEAMLLEGDFRTGMRLH
ncbi:hypothetical protein [Micavibrio aeruginosavorus]|uniref:Uncharacterized protein n=1 Tax=Micavibrio aeruginosavorus (strain ARL-13) TaxID=856793 RepID=G2KSV9_MICAA|nr:hypothetical protein [Micavibrio aeruginosavorus]AEP10104.1 hypothetical protein MICA_1793 [Micavibrio aeruginosavorus ARL-13]